MKRVSILAVGILALSLSAPLTSASGGTGDEFPPDGIYTCEWIADHPVAAIRAGVTCSPTPPPVVPDATVTLVDPRSIGRTGAASAMYTCFRLPNQGQVGQGVFAWSSGYPYTHYWDINVYAGPDYTWYVQNVGGTNVYSEHVTNWAIHVASVANGGLPGSNYYRVGAQNHAPEAAFWQSCYD